ncbi:MAG: hypothetical protein JO061_19450 [Acidobacteriaceae bacterium]|nr:hypothetical protein [Acidobacteriaceae bacterium]
MRKFRQLASLLFLITTFAATFAVAQGNLTQIRDTIYNADGTPFNGTVVITWNGYSTTVSGTVSPLSTSARIYNGALSVLLVPTTTAAAGSYYQVVYSSSDGTVQWTETWQVPPSANALSVAGVRTSSTTGSGSGSGSSSGSGSGSGTGSGSGSGSTQYATLPIAMSQVTGLTSSLNTLTSSVNTNTSNIGTLQTNVSNLTNTVSGLSSTSSTLSFVFVDAETPSGTPNGTNTAFTLSAAPTPASSLELYRNGLVQTNGVDYTLSGSSVTFLSVAVPKTGDILQAYYRKSGSTPMPAFSDDEIPGGAINGTNTTFTLAAAPSPASSLKLYKNGMLLLQSGDYTLNGAQITFAASAVPQTGDALCAYYRH